MLEGLLVIKGNNYKCILFNNGFFSSSLRVDVTEVYILLPK
jgi:hypothetical protein